MCHPRCKGGRGRSLSFEPTNTPRPSSVTCPDLVKEPKLRQGLTFVGITFSSAATSGCGPKDCERYERTAYLPIKKAVVPSLEHCPSGGCAEPSTHFGA